MLSSGGPITLNSDAPVLESVGSGLLLMMSKSLLSVVPRIAS